MAREEILQRIKAAELEADQAVKRAEGERDALLREAKREALRIEDELRSKAEDAYGSVLRALGEETRRESDKVLAEGQRRAEELRSKSFQNLDNAIDLLLTIFEEEVRAKA